MKVALHWFRRDLRLADNTALWNARAQAERVVPVFCWDDAILSRPDVGAPRVWFLAESLAELGQSVEQRNGRLIVVRGRPETEIPALAKTLGAEAVFWNSDYEPYARERDARVAEALSEKGIAARPAADLLLVEPDAVATQAGAPFSVFTPFYRAWDAAPRVSPLPAVEDFGGAAVRQRPDADPPEISLPAGFDEAAWVPGESAANERLESFSDDGLGDYAEGRDRPAIDGTSRLSPYLKFGCISPRTVLEKCRENAKFVQELAWREFYFHVLWHWPEVAEKEWQSAMRGMEWDSSEALLDAWKQGRTGYPLVDAGMRQLAGEGWMHNRVRMVTASFLTKDLHLDWRLGERHFMLTLVDGDLAPNNGRRQWAASTGVDPRPLRIFNPWLQSERYDPEGAYIRRWLPELQGVPAKHIHRPHLMTPEEQGSCGCRIGVDYPAPIVDHAEERLAALAMYAAAKGAKRQQ